MPILETGECLDINQIFRPTRSLFVSKECIESDEPQLPLKILAFHRALNALLKTHSIDACENLNLSGFPADFNYEGRLQKVRPIDADSAKPKIIKNLDQLFRVLLVDADEKINVSSISGKPVKSYRIATHDDVLNGPLARKRNEV